MKISTNQNKSVEETFKVFLSAKRAVGVSAKTISSYKSHFTALSRHLNVKKKMSTLTKDDTNAMICSLMDSGVSQNTAHSYSVTFKAFISWCNDEGISLLTFKLIKGEETIKEPYTDEELRSLLKKPNLRECEFAEYRSYVTIFLS